jgi:hypothetical protein
MSGLHRAQGDDERWFLGLASKPVTPHVTKFIIIIFLKLLIKHETILVNQILDKTKEVLQMKLKLNLQEQVKTPSLKSQTTFYELIYHPCANRISVFKVHQFLKIPIKFHQIQLNFKP